ncbi:MAG: hypothetical protein AB7Q17_06185 [Phycisphaerae bacterium]
MSPMSRRAYETALSLVQTLHNASPEIEAVRDIAAETTHGVDHSRELFDRVQEEFLNVELLIAEPAALDSLEPALETLKALRNSLQRAINEFELSR